jgi:hypothetical protein
MYLLPQGVDTDVWFTFIADLLNKPLPEGRENIEPLGQPESYEDRKQWPWWKVCLIKNLHFYFFILNLRAMKYLF